MCEIKVTEISQNLNQQNRNISLVNCPLTAFPSPLGYTGTLLHRCGQCGGINESAVLPFIAS